VLVYVSAMSVSTKALTLPKHFDPPPHPRDAMASAVLGLMLLAHLRKGETYGDLVEGFGIGITTAHRYLYEGCAEEG
jgi:hypothetical protein